MYVYLNITDFLVITTNELMFIKCILLSLLIQSLCPTLFNISCATLFQMKKKKTKNKMAVKFAMLECNEIKK